MGNDRDRAIARITAMRDGDDILHNTGVQQALDWTLWLLEGPIFERSDRLYTGLDAIDEMETARTELNATLEALDAERRTVKKTKQSQAKCKADLDKARTELLAERRTRRSIEQSRARWKSKATGKAVNSTKTRPPQRRAPQSRAVLRLVETRDETRPGG